MQTTRRTPLNDRRLVWGLIALTGLIIDQVTKTIAVNTLDPSDPVVLLGGLLTLQLTWNDGAAFSLGGGGNITWLFTLFATAVLCGVVWFVLRRLQHRGWGLVLGLLTAGILGNLGDRYFRAPGPGVGHVVDFLQLPKWPIFNVADMCVSFAAVGIIWLSVIKNVSPSEPASGAQDAEDSDDGDPAAATDPRPQRSTSGEVAE